MRANRKGALTSLRSILILWFILFSIVPLAFVAWYSIVKFKVAIENEQIQRLKAHGREVEVIIADYLNQLKENREYFVSNPHFSYNLGVGDKTSLKELADDWLKQSVVNSLATFDRDGRRISFSYKEFVSQSNATEIFGEGISLDNKLLGHLFNKTDYGLIRRKNDEVIELCLISKINNSSGKTLGYIEQKILITERFLQRIKDKLKIELVLATQNSEIVSSTVPIDRQQIRSMFARHKSKTDSGFLYELSHEKYYYGFIVQSILWGDSSFILAIGTNKKESQLLLNNINIAFIGVTSVVILFLVITMLISTSVLLHPINQLIEGIRTFEKTDSLVQLKVKNKTELGILTSAFNQMSMRIYQARLDLKKKLKELENANNNLKEAQTKLVHSAKMTSLGQLVAGVAHELNNPIGFIYSNTAHLEDYSEKLFKIIEEIEKNPQNSSEIKKNYDYEYIKTDLPRMIKSYQDGAKRTRDIVLGLRNFSRIEESQLKEIDIHEAIDTTLELLKGEIKTRIKINKKYENVPKIFCFASQINQVLMNILSNAVQAIQGTGQIWISTSSIKASEKNQGKIQISIQDTGTGMSQQVLEKIFEPFFTTKDVGQGTGLGLSISYGIIQNHGGDIQVKSEKGVGTEFIVTIPIAQNKK